MVTLEIGKSIDKESMSNVGASKLGIVVLSHKSQVWDPNYQIRLCYGIGPLLSASRLQLVKVIVNFYSV